MNCHEARRQSQRELCSRYYAEDGGFRKALWQIVEEAALFDRDEAKHLFDEYYGNFRVIPLAYKVYKERGHRPHIYVYENNLTDRKLESYARIADGDGPSLTVYIVDRFNRIRCLIDNDELAASQYGRAPVRKRVSQTELKYLKVDCNEMNSLTAELAALKGELASIRSSKIKTNRTDERAILRAVYELGLVKEGDTL